jgi:hypothetical protein
MAEIPADFPPPGLSGPGAIVALLMPMQGEVMYEPPPDIRPSIVDLASEDSFPASDPPSWTTGVVRPAPLGPRLHPQSGERRKPAEPAPSGARLR